MAWPFASGTYTPESSAHIAHSQTTNISSTQSTLIQGFEKRPESDVEQGPRASATTSAVQASRWERYPDPIAWTSSRDMIILLESRYLFCVDIGRLEQYSITIREIFGIPQSTSDEGTETNPVRIPDILADDFVLFLRWFNAMPGIPVAPVIDEKLLVGVIRVCNPWMIATGKRWAISQLNILSPPLSPSRRLRLSRELNINEWVHHAVAELMKRNVGSKRIRLITDDEINDHHSLAL